MNPAIDEPPPGLRREFSALDRNVYQAVAGAQTPTADRLLRGLSRAADRSVLWLSIAGVLALAGGPQGRRAAARGVATIGVTSAVVNLGVKPLARRRRPQRGEESESRHVPMPHSTSFPSGHSASAFAFAEGVGSELPWLAAPLRVAAAAVAYSRVHTGVHYPGDVIAGSLIGMSAGEVVTVLSQRFAPAVARSLPPQLPDPGTPRAGTRTGSEPAGTGASRLTPPAGGQMPGSEPAGSSSR